MHERQSRRGNETRGTLADPLAVGIHLFPAPFAAFFLARNRLVQGDPPLAARHLAERKRRAQNTLAFGARRHEFSAMEISSGSISIETWLARTPDAPVHELSSRARRASPVHLAIAVAVTLVH